MLRLNVAIRFFRVRWLRLTCLTLTLARNDSVSYLVHHDAHDRRADPASRMVYGIEEWSLVVHSDWSQPVLLGRWNWNSVYKRFARWTDQGVWAQMHQHCSDDPDLEYLIIDSTVVRAHPWRELPQKRCGPEPRRGSGFCRIVRSSVHSCLGNPLRFGDAWLGYWHICVHLAGPRGWQVPVYAGGLRIWPTKEYHARRSCRQLIPELLRELHAVHCRDHQVVREGTWPRMSAVSRARSIWSDCFITVKTLPPPDTPVVRCSGLMRPRWASEAGYQIPGLPALRRSHLRYGEMSGVENLQCDARTVQF